MDQYLSTVIIAIITGVFSVITLLIQKKQDTVINKIDEQTKIVKREKELKLKLSQKEKEKDEIVNKIMLMILETNIYILKNTESNDKSNPKCVADSALLTKQYEEITAEIQKLKTEYEMILNLTSDLSTTTTQNK